MPRTTLEGWWCYRCEHKWIPRDESHPKVCPKCKSPYWDTPRKDEKKSYEKARRNAKRN